MRLTEKYIRDTKPSSAIRIDWDDVVKGLGLRVTPTGVKAYVFNYRVDGCQRRMTLGRISELSLAQARDVASDARQATRAGRDPLQEQRSRRASPTVADGLERYLNEHIPARVRQGRMAAKTVKEYRRQIETYLRPKLGRLRIGDVSKHDVQLVLQPLPPIMANRVQALVSSLFNQFENWEWRAQNTNPARGIEKAVEDARDRTLNTEELSAIGRALHKMPDGNPGAILAIRLAAITGLRIGEIQNLSWADVDLSDCSAVLRQTKTGRRIHTLPTAAVALLLDAKRVGKCVIPGRNPNRPLDYGSIRRHWVRACTDAGISGVRLHDLRRTFMTRAASQGVGAHLLRDIVGHKTTTMADRYVRQAGAPLRKLREEMGASIASKILSGEKINAQ